MKSINIEIGNIVRPVQVPESWNEVDQRTLLLFWNALFHAPGDEYSAATFTAVKLIGMTGHILSFSPETMESWRQNAINEHGEDIGETMFFSDLVSIMQQSLGGLFDIETDDDTGAKHYAPKMNLTKCPYPVIVDPGQKKKPAHKQTRPAYYYAPDDALGNISLYEMAYSFAQFEAYQSTNDEQYANRLLAVLWRPSRPYTKAESLTAWKGDRRQPLRGAEKKIEERLELVETLPVLTKRVLLFWFACCRNTIMQQFPRVFKESEGGESANWGEMLLAVAGGPAAVESVSDQHYSNALTWLSMKDKEADEYERKRGK